MSQERGGLWHYYVLGVNRLESGLETYAPERRTAALLSYLAFEGATPRSRLAGLLWPDSEEATARNNLSQALRRFRALTSEPLVVAGDDLNLAPGLTVDVARLKAAALSGDAEGVIATRGDLLASFDYDDLPEFGEWLYSTREAIVALRSEALLTLIRAHEAESDYTAALRYAERLLGTDPVSEVAYRQVMRLHYLLGDRPAALRTYHRCRETLARELGVEPLPETAELARMIEQGGVKRRTGASKTALPPQILRPPVLVGREREWAKLEAAWARHQTVYVTGEPGVGKTRLVQEFVAGKGRGLYLGAQPGYQDVLFAAAAGLARARIEAAPDTALPEWVEHELSRILPEFRTQDPLPPLRSENDRLRFYQAYLEMARLKGAGFAAVISDDVQYYDPATVELGAFMIAQRAAALGEAAPRHLIVYRLGELGAAAQSAIDRFVASGVAARLELEPLGSRETTSLLVSLNLASLEDGVTPALAEAVHRRTGGNTLFILETLRDLLETDGLGGAFPERLPLSPRISATVGQRLARFSLTAQRVVQAAAVLRRDFDVDLIAAVLGSDPLSLLETWEALERAHILSGNRFSHDLLQEAVLSGLSPQVEALLHRRSAEVLASRGASPMRVANHYLASGDDLRAAPFLLRAAVRAKDALRLVEAAERFARVGAIFEANDDRAGAFEAYRQAFDVRLEFDLGEVGFESALAKLRSAARTPLMRAMVGRLAAQRHLRRGDYVQAEAAALAGLAELSVTDDLRARTDLLAYLALALARQNRPEASAEVAATLRAMMEGVDRDDGSETAWSSDQLSRVAALLDELGHRTEALTLYRRALALPSSSRDRLIQLAEYGYSLLTYGDAPAALRALLEASEQLTEVAEAAVIKTRVLTSLGVTYHSLGRFADALRVYGESLAISEEHGHGVQSEGTRVRRARLYLSLGALDEAEADLRDAQTSAAPQHIHQIYLRALEARLATRRGTDKGEHFARIERALEGGDVRLRVFVRLEQILALPFAAPEARADFAKEIFDLSRSFELPTVDIAAHTFYAQRLLALGQAEEARVHSECALTLLGTHTSVYLYPLEVVLSAAQVFAALGDSRASALLARAVGDLEALLEHVPEVYRRSFLSANVINQAVMDAAAAAGLTLPEGLQVPAAPPGQASLHHGPES